MKTLSVLLSSTLLILLSGCASTPTADIKIDSEADPKARFAGYQSYSWLGGAAIVHDEIGSWEPPAFDADAQAKYLIDRELRKRGMSETSADPDLLVAFAAGIDMDVLRLQTDPDTNFESLTRTPKGALVIVLVDADSGFVIWAGAATANVRPKPDTATAKARLDFAVTQLLNSVPR